jgi:general secretion pathway protein D
MSYRDLQSLLRLHGFSVVEIAGVYNVVPEAHMRQLPLPVIDKDANNIGDDDCVVKVISAGKLEAVRLLPILRPMLPQYAHLAALSDNNALVIVATYANVKTIEATVRALERQPLAQQKVAQVN